MGTRPPHGIGFHPSESLVAIFVPREKCAATLSEITAISRSRSGSLKVSFYLASQHVLIFYLGMPHLSQFPTQKSVAAASGVSRAAVGAILSGGEAAARYSPATRERVEAVAQRMHYRPHRGAQAMRKQRSNLIAIVHFGAGIEAAHKSNLALSRELNAAGFDCLAVDMNWHGGSVDRILEELIQARIEGVLISHIQDVFSDEHIHILRQAGIPLVSINGERRENVSLICDNALKAFGEMTSHLLALGHRRILQLLPAFDLTSGSRSYRERKEGFASAFATSGRWFEVADGDFSMDLFTGGGVQGITVNQNPRGYELLERPVYHFCKSLGASGFWPDAIVCSNDSYGVEAIMAAFEAGLNVPGDFAVTGYDNDRIGEFPILGLTTAEQDLENICTTAVRTLVERLRDPNLPAVTKKFDSKLILRSSCGTMASANL